MLTVNRDNLLFLTCYFFCNVIALLQAALNLLSSSLLIFPLLSIPTYTEVWYRLFQLLFDYIRDCISAIAYNAEKGFTEITNHTIQLSVSI